MIVRVLFVDSDAGSLARIKGALEKAGDYEAVVFTTGEAALEDASQTPPTVAVVSLNVRDVTPTTIVEGLRAIRPEIPILLRAPGAADQRLLETLAPFDVLYGGYSSRVLLPMIEDALSADLLPPKKPLARPGAQPEAEGPVTNGHQVLRQTHADDDLTAFGEVLDAIEPGPQSEEQDTFKTLVESLRTPVERPSMLKRRPAGQEDWGDEPGLDESDAGDTLFDKLAAEEPPQPALEDSGTVRDLIAAADPDLETAAQTAAVDVPDEIIEDAESRPVDRTEQDLLDALAAVSDEPPAPVAAPAGGDLVPMPEEVRQRFGEPVVAGSDQAAALAVQLTQHTLAISATATMLLRDNRLVTWAGGLSELDVRALAETVDCATVLAGGKIRIRYAALRESRDSFMIVAAPTLDDMVLVMILDQNTQVSSIQQQAAVLTNALRETLEPSAPPAEPPAPPDESDLFFPETPAPDASEAFFPAVAEADDSAHGVTGALEIEGEDAQPVAAEPEDRSRVAAREALESAPQIDPATLVKYACAWMLRDPESELDGDLVAAVPAWVGEVSLSRQWLADQVEAQPDYVSVVINVPPAAVPSEVVDILKQELGQRILGERPALAASPEQLWADAYYAVAPGRPLTGEEISRFISFQRGN